MSSTTPAASAWRRWPFDLAASVALLLVPIIGFAPTFDGPVYLIAALGGLVLGVAIAAAGAWRRWGILVLAAVTIVAYFVFGAALALPHTAIGGVVPTLDSLYRLAIGVVTSWKSLLTTVPPVAAADGHLVVPYVLALVAAVLTTSLAMRLNRAAWALVPAAGFLAVQIALGTPEPAVPILQGVLFAVAAIAWLSLREAFSPARSAVSISGDDSALRSPGGALRRTVAGGLVIAVACGLGVASTALAAPNEIRYVLRDVIIPPFDIREYPSPLQSFRKYVRDHAEKPLFTVEGMPDDARVRLATMDDYSGTVYNVSDDGTGSSGAFTPIRSNMSAEANGDRAELRVEIADYAGEWVPDVGAVTDIRFHGDRAEQLRRSTFYNETTGTALTTDGLREGDAYTLDVMVPEVPGDEALADRGFAPVTIPDPENVPPELSALAADALKQAEASTPFERVKALEAFLHEGGFFSHGLEGEALSRAGHGSERISTLIGAEQMVGDDEQYATTMALMAHELGIPARVVMGFHPDEDDKPGKTFSANGDTLHAWVEVAFEGAGWVPFDPAPPEDQIPNDQTTQPKPDPKPQVLQPPPPPQEPVDLPPLVPDDREAEDESNPVEGILGVILAVGGVSLLVVALLLSPFLIIGAFKAARRRRRREAERAVDRISGGWEELRDRVSDYGKVVPPGRTRGEEAGVVAEAIEDAGVVTLAARADASVFGPVEPTPEEVDSFWNEVDGIVGGVREKASFWGRMKARLNLRSLLGRSRFADRVRMLRESARRRKDG